MCGLHVCSIESSSLDSQPPGNDNTANESNFSMPNAVMVNDCKTDTATGTVVDLQSNDHNLRLEERRPSGTEETFWGNVPLASHNDSSSVMDTGDSVNGSNLPPDIDGDVLKDSGGRSEMEEESMPKESDEAIDWNAGGINNPPPPPEEKEERCVRCGKLRPAEQCPVCHCMYISVEKHISVHSIKKRQTPSSLLPATIEDANDFVGNPPMSTEGNSEGRMCTDCGEIFPNARRLRLHVKSKSCLKFAICMVCGTVCENLVNLRSHMKEVHPNLVFENADIEDGRNVSAAKTVKKKRSPNFSCAVCDMKFGDADSLSRHMMDEHTSRDQRVCLVCSKIFMNPDNLKAHMRRHTGRMPYQCEVCGKPCRSQQALREHGRTHSAEMPYICTVCGRHFRLRSTYLKHRVLHSGQKNYECKFCGMKFPFNYRRARHMLVHTGEKPYVCDGCGERFAQWNGRYQHRLRSCRKYM